MPVAVARLLIEKSAPSLQNLILLSTQISISCYGFLLLGELFDQLGYVYLIIAGVSDVLMGQLCHQLQHLIQVSYMIILSAVIYLEQKPWDLSNLSPGDQALGSVPDSIQQELYIGFGEAGVLGSVLVYDAIEENERIRQEILFSEGFMCGLRIEAKAPVPLMCFMVTL